MMVFRKIAILLTVLAMISFAGCRSTTPEPSGKTSEAVVVEFPGAAPESSESSESPAVPEVPEAAVVESPGAAPESSESSESPAVPEVPEAAFVESPESAPESSETSEATAVPEEDSCGPWTPSRLENELAGEDPLEGFNRAMFACTDFVMEYVADPVGRVYTSILPRPVIEKINNLCVNLEFPARAFSCLLRAEWGGAGDETARFLINTTMGIAGLFDPAAYYFDFYSTDSNFGQAFAEWGIGPGCTLVLPLMSSVNVRDTVGSIFDMAFDLKTYIPYAGYATALNRMVIAERTFSKTMAGSSDKYKSFRELSVAQREIAQRLYFYHLRNAAAEARRQAKAAAEAAENAAEEKESVEPSAEGATSSSGPEWEPTPKPAELTGNWNSIRNYQPQTPVLDTMRVARFVAENNDDPWYFRLSWFNSDFSKKCLEREIEFAADRPELQYGFWKAPEPEEEPESENDEKAAVPERLAILLPGIGGNYYGMTSTALAELLNRHGWMVLALDSTFSWQFMTAVGNNPLPGFLPEDAENVRMALRRILDSLERDELISAPEIVMLGYSFGALHTLKISELEEKEPMLGIQRFLAINPPVELSHAMERADSLAETGSGWTASEAIDHLVDAGGQQVAAMMTRFPPFDPEAEPAEGVDYRAPISEEDANYIAALYFRISMRGLLFVAHRERGLPQFAKPYKWGDRNALYCEIDRVSFREYAEQFLAPEKPDIPLAELYRQSGLRSIEESLKGNPKIRVIHNYDDFLLTPEDRLWLDRTLGTRLTWFDHGAHLGNLYVTTVQQAILDALVLPADE